MVGKIFFRLLCYVVMKQIILTISLFFSITKILAFDTSNFAKIDAFAKKTKSTQTIEKLAHKLTNQYTKPEEKYRAIFTWISYHIAYDTEALKNSKKRITDPKGVLRKKRTVCAGYSKLFQQMCFSVGLECEIISGWARGSKREIGKELGKKTTHAWNAIKLDGQWYLCDVTWAAGYTNGPEFHQDFVDAYFCTPPQLFLNNHYPEDKKWFLTTSISKKKFVNQVYYGRNGTQMMIEDVNLKDGNILYKKDKKIVFEVKVPTAVKKVGVFTPKDKYLTIVDFEQKDGVISFEVSLKKYGKYFLISMDGDVRLVYRMIKQ